MTKMELLTAVTEGAVVTAEMAEKAKAWAETLEKRADKPTKAQVENEGYKDKILEYLEGVDAPVTAAKVAEDTAIVKGKVVALLGQLAKAGKVVAEKGKGKNPMTYAKA